MDNEQLQTGSSNVEPRVINTRQERIKGTEKESPYTPCSIGNSSRVIFRIGIKLPRALRGCFVEVSHD